MRLIRLPAVHQNLMVAFCTRDFLHMHSGAVIRALVNSNLEAAYKRTGEEEERLIGLNLDHLHYYGVTDSGFCFEKPMYDYSDLSEKFEAE
jgi:hypothetical protein